MGATAAELSASEPERAKPRQLGGRSRSRSIFAAVMLLAAAGDTYTFRQVAGLVLANQSQVVVIVIAAGVSGTGLMMAHATGVTLYARKSAAAHLRLAFTIAGVALWATIGAVPFWVSLNAFIPDCVNIPDGATCTIPTSSASLLTAAIFAGVYATTGMVAMVGAYLTHPLRRTRTHANRSTKERRLWDRLSAQLITTFAARVAGRERADLYEEWSAHLAGQVADTESKWHGRRDAAGFLVAAVRCRIADAADVMWRPVDAVLSSRPLSNLFVWGPVIVMLVAIVRHDGRFGLVADVQDPAALGAFLYGAIRTGRWWRGIKPPEPKARRASER